MEPPKMTEYDYLLVFLFFLLVILFSPLLGALLDSAIEAIASLF